MIKPIIWTIAGADCSGGAGIAADIKTGHSLHVEVCHLITANTVQNAAKLLSINPVDIALLAQQVEVLKNDKPPRVLKIGLLVSIEQLNWLKKLIGELKLENPSLIVVLDPVGTASVGGKLSALEPKDYHALLPFIDVITPNIDEAKALVDAPFAEVKTLASTLAERGQNTVVVKGGHSDNETVVDVAFDQRENRWYQLESPRINTRYTHGGGCSFAMALASYIAHGYLLRDAFTLTKAFINKGMHVNRGKLDYYGAFEQPLGELNAEYFPQIESLINDRYTELSAFPSIGSQQGDQALGLYPVVDSLAWLEKLLPLGLEIIQLRIKEKSSDVLNAIIAEAVNLSARYHTRLFINDHWQLAIKHGAYGVHLGQEDLLEADLAAIHNAGIRLGISTHGCYEFLLAQQLRPSYLAIGAIFPTKTKDMTGQIQGLDNLRQILAIAKHVPVVAIGGITLDNARAVLETGVDSIAVVTAITESACYSQAVTKFQQLLPPSTA